jgi:hypothetical protein
MAEEKRGWDLVTARPLTDEQRRRIAELARAKGKDVEKKPRRKAARPPRPSQP